MHTPESEKLPLILYVDQLQHSSANRHPLIFFVSAVALAMPLTNGERGILIATICQQLSNEQASLHSRGCYKRRVGKQAAEYSASYLHT